MKKYMNIVFCIFASLCAIKPLSSRSQEWNAEEYAQGNSVQYQSALYFLAKNNIEIEGKSILDVACGTGEISSFLAQTAKLVDGFDASNNMIAWAQKYRLPHHRKISFRQCCVEDFSSDKQYDLATMFFCFHWFTDKQKALNQISASLKQGGELFGTFSTNDIPQPPGHAIIKELMAKWNLQADLKQSLGRSTVSTQELKIILTNAGFDIIKCELQENNIIFAHRTDVEKFARPVMMSRPFMQEMLPEQREQFFNEYIDALLLVLHDSESDQLILRMYLTIVHAQKKADSHEK